MDRILGIDYGEKRIGLALSDPMQIIASPFKVLENNPHVYQEISEIVEEHTVSLVVLGNPVNLKGQETASTQKAKDFKQHLEQHLSVPVTLWDERLSTRSANNALLQGNVRRDKRKQIVDKIAAVFILQSYLDCRPKR